MARKPAKREKVRLCTPVSLPERHLIKAAEYACGINPANAPALERFVPVMMSALTSIGTEGAIQAAECLRSEDARDVGEAVTGEMARAMMTTKWWGSDGVDLSVSFVENTTAALQNKLLAYMNKWGETANVRFRATASGGDVRVSRGAGGYWSYMGTDIRSIPRGQQTMNLAGFTLSTPESEYERVVTHEAGHTLGMPHEHMRAELVRLLDQEKTIEYFRRTQGWSAQEVRQQVLTPLEERSILMATESDQDSIMCYQLPGSITKSGQPIRGGTRINEGDAAFVARVYPKVVTPPPPVAAGTLTVSLETKTVFLPAGWKSQPA